MKRFYTLVSSQKEPGGYAVLLDGRAVNTPLKRKLLCSTEALANALVQEWAAQKETIKLDTMPLTQLVSTQLDQVTHGRAKMSAEVLKYLNTDLLCYRTDQPPELAQKQAQSWDRWLEWFAGKFGAQLETTTTIQALSQPQAAHDGARGYVEALDDQRFTIAQLITPLSGSVVLAIAFTEGEISPEELFSAIRVEEQFRAGIYNEEKYGPDPAQEKKGAAIKVDLAAAARYLELID